MNTSNFETLRQRYGSHSEAARVLGITPSHYRYVRSSGKASAGLKTFIASLAAQDAAPATQQAQPPDAA